IESFTDPEFLLANLFEHSPYNVDHLRRRFEQATGQTPQDYLTGLRIEHAKKLMRENHLLHYSIAEIGALSGYLDNHYFSRVFKKRTGVSPTEYASAAGQRGNGPEA
ncbi:MAG TPA: helix-turn-helix transcriptional regulator, partial [Clostridia bacterium]|nr:helix-turn-helix transcriptional regulator [Clostridia bacterium]